MLIGIKIWSTLNKDTFEDFNKLFKKNLKYAMNKNAYYRN